MRLTLAQFMLVVFVAVPVLAQQRSSNSNRGGQQRIAVRSTVATQAAPVQRNASRAKFGSNGGTTNRTVVVNRYYNNNGYRFGVFSPGGYYGGYGYYPGPWYSNSVGVGYRFGFAPHISEPGIKFDLDEVKGKDRKLAENADVYLPSEEGQDGYLGRVKNFSGGLHRALPLQSGTYDLKVVVADGREITMSVTVQPQRITHVALRLDMPEETEKSTAKK